MGKDVTDYEAMGIPLHPFQLIVNQKLEQVAKARKNLRLGQLIEKLKTALPTAQVSIKQWDLRPTTWDSYRGIYADLALGFTMDETKPRLTAAELLAMTEACVGKVFTGYKGGDYEMDLETNLWVANYGEAGSMAIASVEIWPENAKPGESQYVELDCRNLEDE